MLTPEHKARHRIDGLLRAAGWSVQPRAQLNLGASRGVAVAEFPLKTGYADYLLFVDRQAVGVIEAKAEGTTLSGVAEQSAAYLTGLPAKVPHVQLPLPFAYESTGVETFFRDERDPEPRSRRVFAFDQPERLAEWATEERTLREFQQYVTPDDGRKFAELYNVQHMTSNVLEPVSKVCITTIQRLYSMLSGEPEFDHQEEELAVLLEELSERLVV